MAHDSSVPSSIPFRVLDSASGATKILIAVLVALGILAAVLAVGTPERLWQSLLFNWLFWSSVAIGMVMFAVALRLSNADWAWSIRRFALGGAAFLPISFVLLPVVLFGGHEHFFHHWLHVEGDPVIDAKRAWLNWPGLAIRELFVVAVVYALALVFAYYSVRPDVYGVKNTRNASFYERLTRGFRGVEEEAARSWKLTARIGAVLGIVFAVFWGVVAVDLAMSLSPHWFSTMFPVAFFWAAFHSGVAATTIAAVFYRSRLGLQDYITRSQYHDFGKMLFAFSVFWMYLNWSQYIVIWYGQLPWEQDFFVQRFNEPFGPLSAAVVILVFVMPLLGLLTRAPKMVPQVLVFFALSILVGLWIERFLLVYPSLWEEETLPLGIPEIGIGLGFFGLFVAAYTWYLTRVPVLPSPATLAAREPTLVEVQVPATATER
ncbi:MAG TPA: hypothetical protein VF167_09800 [Longimicrobiaceae bacterium]